MDEEPGVDLSEVPMPDLGEHEQQVMDWLLTHQWHVQSIQKMPPPMQEIRSMGGTEPAWVQTGSGEIVITISVLP